MARFGEEPGAELNSDGIWERRGEERGGEGGGRRRWATLCSPLAFTGASIATIPKSEGTGRDSRMMGFDFGVSQHGGLRGSRGVWTTERHWRPWLRL